MDEFNTPWRVTTAAIHTTPADSRIYGTLDIDVTEARRFIEEKPEAGIKSTMTHIVTTVISRAVAFDVEGTCPALFSKCGAGLQTPGLQ